MQNRNCIPFRETLCDFVAYRTGNHHSMLCLNYCMLKIRVAMPQYNGTLVHSGHKDFAERWPSHWQVTRVESFELSKSSEFPRMLMFWGDVLRVHGKNGKMFPPPLWVYRSQECLSLMVDVLKVLCTSISLMSWLRYTAHGAAACRSDCHSLSKWSSLLTRHDLLQKRSWSGIKRGHPRRGPPPSQHPVLYHRNSCWSLQRVSSGGNGGNPGVCDVAFWNCVFEKHDYPQVCDVHSRARHRLGDCPVAFAPAQAITTDNWEVFPTRRSWDMWLHLSLTFWSSFTGSISSSKSGDLQLFSKWPKCSISLTCWPAVI